MLKEAISIAREARLDASPPGSSPAHQARSWQVGCVEGFEYLYDHAAERQVLPSGDCLRTDKMKPFG